MAVVSETSRSAAAPDEPRGDWPAVNLDEAVETLNRLHGEDAYASLMRKGQYVLRMFYADDPRLYGQRGGAGAPSLRRLLARDDLRMSRGHLASAIRLAVFERLHPGDSNWASLCATSRVALLRLKDPAAIRQAAAIAAHGPGGRAMTVDAVLRLVRQMLRARADRPRGRGRPPTPPPIKALRAATRVLEKGGLGADERQVQLAATSMSRAELQVACAEARRALDVTRRATAWLEALLEAGSQALPAARDLARKGGGG